MAPPKVAAYEARLTVSTTMYSPARRAHDPELQVAMQPDSQQASLTTSPSR